MRAAGYFLVAIPATATAATAAVLGLVNLDVAAAELAAVEGANGVLSGAALRHFHESEATRAAALAIRDHGHGLDRTVPTEEILEICLGAIEGKVADVKFIAQWIVLFAPSRYRTTGNDRTRFARDIRA